MASVADGKFLERAVQNAFERELRDNLQQVIDKVAKEVLDKTVKELQSNLQTNVDRYRDIEHLGEFIRVVVLDKRS